MNPLQRSELGRQLCEAAEKGDLSALESLIAQEADVNHTDTDYVSVFFLWRGSYQYITMWFLGIIW
jgi:hypothetical protein